MTISIEYVRRRRSEIYNFKYTTLDLSRIFFDTILLDIGTPWFKTKKKQQETKNQEHGIPRLIPA